MKFLSIAVLSFALLSCHPRKSTELDAKKSSPPAEKTTASASATVAASPNPVPAGAGPGETTITWDTGEKSSGDIYVSKNGKAEDLFASARSGSKKVKWIQSHMRYEFRLYEGNAHTKLLSQVEVRRAN